MMTDRDIRNQVQHVVDASEGTYNVVDITTEIISRWGRVDIDSIEHDEFWSVVRQYATS